MQLPGFIPNDNSAHPDGLYIVSIHGYKLTSRHRQDKDIFAMSNARSLRIFTLIGLVSLTVFLAYSTYRNQQTMEQVEAKALSQNEAKARLISH
jgi:hypothetical protein